MPQGSGGARLGLEAPACTACAPGLGAFSLPGVMGWEWKDDRAPCYGEGASSLGTPEKGVGVFVVETQCADVCLSQNIILS